MKIFYNVSFKGHYPVGTSAIVVAETRTKASKQLEKSLELIGLSQSIKAKEMIEIDLNKAKTIIIQNGDY